MTEYNDKRCTKCILDDGENWCSCDPKESGNKKCYLGSDTVLRGNFVVGKTISSDGETTHYMGYDRQSEEKIVITEYFPYPISQRHENCETILPSSGKEVSYKALMSEFEEIINLQTTLSSDYNIIAPYNVLADNNTIYGIYNYNEYTPLEKYLEDKGAPLVWNDIKGAFLQLCSTVMAIHKKGVIHRGICPENIMINSSGLIYLTGFSTAANRTDDSEIKSTLYEGYSAPEQYSIRGWQSEWTDVYGLAALLYTMLTGVVPIRDDNGNIKPAIDINPNIPDFVSQGIAASLIEQGMYRLGEVDRFTAMLLEDTSASTAVFDSVAPTQVKATQIPSVKDIQHTIHGGTIIIEDVEKALEEAKKQSATQIPEVLPVKQSVIRLRKRHGFLVATVALVIIIALGLIDDYNNVPIEIVPVESPPVIMDLDTKYLPDFTGQNADEVVNLNASQDSYRLIIREDFSSTVLDGDIISQKPEPGTSYVNKPYVILTVSTGMREIPMPSIIGLTTQEAIDTLTAYGINHRVFEVIDESLTEGYIGRATVEPGEMVDIYDDTVYLYTGVNVEVESEDTEDKEDGSTE